MWEEGRGTDGERRGDRDAGETRSDDERDETETAADTTRRVGSRASRAVGGLVGVLVAIAIGIGTVIVQTGMQLDELAMVTFDAIGANPEAFSGLFVGILGWLGMTGIVVMSPLQFLGIALVIVGLGIALAAYTAEKRGYA